MRHLAIFALFLAAACGGKSDQGATVPDETEPEGSGSAETPAPEQDYLYGTLVSVSETDEGCVVEFVDNQSEDESTSTYRARASLCAEDFSDYVDSPVALTMEECTDESECFMLGDPIVVALEGMAPG